MYNLVKTEQKQIGKKEKIHIKNNINKNIKNNINKIAARVIKWN
jgi:hypothetical protein